MSLFKTRLSISILPALVLLVIFLAGCGGDGYGDNPGNSNPPPENPPDNTVTISNFSFSPSSLTVSAGDTVTWRNNDAVQHTVTSDSGSELDSPLLGQGATYTHIFSTAGTYPYHCTVHTYMTASVTAE
jgi:plastocyanin